MMIQLRSFSLLIAYSCFACHAALANVSAEKTETGITIKANGQPFAEYVFNSGGKPIVWPVVGPTGKRMTRNWPMETGVPGETDRDHPHQRSLWFTHGDVNGIDFWTMGKGRIEHRELVKADSGPEAVVTTRNDWVNPADGKLVLQDERTLTFGADAERRWIDFLITLKAAGEPVVFGDTKEGSFGVRTASSMRVDSKKGGRIVNSEGKTDGGAWGKPAAWVDYHGPVEGETLGIAILNHPTSFRFPTHWHVRTYGLFAANPFGLKDFTAGVSKGEYTLPAGESMKLRYRVLLHKGDEKEGRVAEAFVDFAK